MSGTKKSSSSISTSKRPALKTPIATSRLTRSKNFSTPSDSTTFPPINGLTTLNSTILPLTNPSTSTNSITLPPVNQSDKLTNDCSEPGPKRTRGHNRGEAARRLVARDRKKLKVTYRLGELRVLGDNASKFATEIGIIIKHHAPLQRSGWSKILPQERDSLYARLKDIFEIDFVSQPYYKAICNAYFSRQYKDYRSKCRVMYDNIVKSGKNPLQNQPSLVVRENDWQWMCNECFSNHKWQLKSKQGAKNRANLTTTHRAGSKSYARHLEEQMNTQTETDQNNGIGRIEMYKKTHWNATHGWTCNKAEGNYNEMIRLKNQHSTQLERESSSNIQVDEAAICKQVLGSAKYGHMPGFGPVLQKKDLIELSINSREDEYRKQYEDLSKTIDDLRKTQQEQAELIKHLVTSLDVPMEHHSFGLDPPRPQSPPSPPPPASSVVA